MISEQGKYFFQLNRNEGFSFAEIAAKYNAQSTTTEFITSSAVSGLIYRYRQKNKIKAGTSPIQLPPRPENDWNEQDEKWQSKYSEG